MAQKTQPKEGNQGTNFGNLPSENYVTSDFIIL